MATYYRRILLGITLAIAATLLLVYFYPRNEKGGSNLEYALHCSCEGEALNPPDEDDPRTGPCTNRENCTLVPSPPQREQLLAEAIASTPPENSELGIPIPPLTNGYTVYVYRADGTFMGVTLVSLDYERDAAGKTRDPEKFKASILNAACVATADGNGLPEEAKDPEFQRFCEGKSSMWCQNTLMEHFELNQPYDFLTQDFCGPYVLRQAQRHVRLVEHSIRTSGISSP